LVIWICLAYTAGFGVYRLRDELLGQYSGPEEAKVLWEAWNLVEKHFYDALPSVETRTYAAIRASLALLDPYTVFVEPQPRELGRYQQGDHGGIGVSVWRDAEGRIALNPFPGSPAEEAGLRNGSILLAVDGEAVSDRTGVSEVQALFRGAVGTRVALTVSCPGSSVLEATITREQIQQFSVTWRMQRAGIGYIGIDRFAESTAVEMAAAVHALEQAQARALVLDLRGNAGGVVDSALAVADRFLQPTDVVVYRRSRTGERTFQAQGADNKISLPLVVLVDGETASAAEIVAGALQHHDRALLIGEATSGKGSVQEVFDLGDGSSVHVTTAIWLTPDRRQIDNRGLMPDIAIRSSDAPGDEQLNRAVACLE
jgi:carboxyl-terminal processing protease